MTVRISKRTAAVIIAAALIFALLCVYSVMAQKSPQKFIVYGGEYYHAIFSKISPEIIGGQIGEIESEETARPFFECGELSSDCLEKGTPLFAINGESSHEPNVIAFYTGGAYRIALRSGGTPVALEDYT